MLGKKLKPRPCSWCRVDFQPWNSLQNTCSIDCAVKKQNEKNKRSIQRAIKQSKAVERKRISVRKEALKTRSDYEKEAEAACNAYIRERDKGLPCISCGTTKTTIQYCAGHYKSKGAFPELRYHPANIHKQCNFHCNSQKSGNIEQYRPELIKKVGILQVQFLEGSHKMQNRTIDDLKEIKVYYREQLKILKQI